MATATGSVANECSSVTIIIQQCLSARLQVQPPTENEDAKWVEITRGIVIYLCFLRGSNLDILPKVVKSILNVRLSETTAQPGNVSVLELPGDILIVPQETVQANSTTSPHSTPKTVKYGTYGNRQVLSVETNGPFTHVFDF